MNLAQDQYLEVLKNTHFPACYKVLCSMSGFPPALIQGPLQRLDCGGLNNLQKIIRQLFRYLHLQLYGTKETPPLSVKSVVYGKIDWGPARLLNK